MYSVYVLYICICRCLPGLCGAASPRLRRNRAFSSRGSGAFAAAVNRGSGPKDNWLGGGDTRSPGGSRGGKCLSRCSGTGCGFICTNQGTYRRNSLTQQGSPKWTDPIPLPLVTFVLSYTLVELVLLLLTFSFNQHTYMSNSYRVPIDGCLLTLTCGYLALCRWKCTLRFPLVENRFPHTLHLKGLSPVCDRIWICSAESEPNTLPQKRHRCL